ncbi:HAD family hydrolase [Candidatus Woesearchaeota archaeon]|nr:HAD family hydrolase [Candidatus Woesearchaeota archaeon]
MLQQVEQKKLFVWDFHGVLEKGNEGAVLENSNFVLEQAGFRQRFSLEDVTRFYGQHWCEYFAWLLPEEQSETHQELQRAAFTRSYESPDVIYDCINPTDHAHEVLDAIDQSLHDQILISNTNHETLPHFMKATGTDRYFPDNKHFAVDNHRNPEKTKQDVLIDFLRENQYSGIVTIGDSPKDIALIQFANGIHYRRSYLYAHPEKEFRECEADHHIRDLRDVLNEIR